MGGKTNEGRREEISTPAEKNFAIHFMSQLLIIKSKFKICLARKYHHN